LSLSVNLLLAQQTEVSVHLFGAASVPYGNFSKGIDEFTGITQREGIKIGDDVGLAQTGFGLGGELNTPVWIDGLFWTFSASFFLNGVDGSKVQKEIRSQWGDTVAVDLEFGNWINVPLLTGFRYDLYFAKSFLLYGIAQIGLNVSHAPSMEAKIDGEIIQDVEYGWGRDWAFQLGIGLVYNQTYNLSIRYLDLGSSRYNGTRNLTELWFPGIYTRVQNIIGEDRSVSMFVVTLGMQLFP
jgi:hypothetical protein